MERTIKVGMMPGRINEYVVDETATIADLLELAELDAKGYDIKVDGNICTSTDTRVAGANLVLLVKQVKGNADGIVRVGMMPGRINEFAAASDTTIAELLEMAELDSKGYDIKVDGNVVTDVNAPIGEASLVLLVKQVKGNF